MHIFQPTNHVLGIVANGKKTKQNKFPAFDLGSWGESGKLEIGITIIWW